MKFTANRLQCREADLAGGITSWRTTRSVYGTFEALLAMGAQWALNALFTGIPA
jgi:hypothetical protein